MKTSQIQLFHDFANITFLQKFQRIQYMYDCIMLHNSHEPRVAITRCFIWEEEGLRGRADGLWQVGWVSEREAAHSVETENTTMGVLSKHPWAFGIHGAKTGVSNCTEKSCAYIIRIIIMCTAGSAKMGGGCLPWTTRYMYSSIK